MSRTLFFNLSRSGSIAAMAMSAFLINAWATEPAQVPLTSRVAEPPTPNVMLTIDDSGSMLADFMPEGNFTVNGKNVNLASPWLGAFPRDWRKLCFSGQDGCVAGAWPFGPTQSYLAGVVTSLKTGSTIHQKQFRSPDVNAIFYNPDLRYQPWYLPDGSGRMANSNPAAARWDPVVSNGVFDLSINYTASSTPVAPPNSKITTNWYTARNSGGVNERVFYPGLVYRLTVGADPTLNGSYTLFDVNATDGTHAASVKHPNRTDCAAPVGGKCTQAEELQNFANWFTYYRMRESLTKAAVSEAFVAYTDKLRVGWGRINQNTPTSIDGTDFTRIETATNGGPMRPLDAVRLNTVLTGVQKITSWPSTPLRTALHEIGRYFDNRAAGSPWLTDPASAGSEKLTCRRSVSLLMTDGYYNDAYSLAGDVDGSDGTEDHTGAQNPNNESPTKYTAVRPFIDAPGAFSNTLADVASLYYVKDLDLAIDNKVAPVSGDIAFWQHLTQFMVGLGVRGTLDSSTPAAKTATLNELRAGTKVWPDPTSGSAQKIDDMWHAAVNTGGDFYSVANVTELTEALKDAFGKASGNEAKEAGVATASAVLVADNVKYVPKYKSVSWYGDLEAWGLDIDGKTGVSPDWKASERVPAHASRNLYTWLDGAATEFKSSSSSVVDLVGSKELVDYIRGDTSKEGDAGDFRSRKVGVTYQLLGDFVNSPPVVVKGLVDLGYSAFDSTYSDFVAKKKARPDSAIFLGGNDGMVHAFRGKDGDELFAYLPSEGLSRLSIVAAKDYGTTTNFHRFFVDGPMNETDAKVDGEWVNLVIGSMGAGGKTFFALRVPTLDATDLGVNTVLWEKSGATDDDIGHIFSNFAVGKVKGGGWKAFVGNGVYSVNGKAVLLVVDIKTGAIDSRIVADSGSGNGLMGVSLIKDAETQEVVGAYAGDLRGNVWRFDFNSSGEGEVGFKGEPLFVAMNADGVRQPITVPPVAALHPTRGRVVLVGTGKLIDQGDSDSIDKQTFYGVWDNVVVGESSVPATSPFFGLSNGRDKLQVQTVDTANPIKDETGTYYTVSANPVNWVTQLGWYMELPFDGQRVVYPTLVLGLDYVYISSLVPARDVAQCETSGGTGYNYLLVASSGAQPSTPIFDTNGDGVVNNEDQVASGTKTGGDGNDAIINDPDNPLTGDGDSGGEGQICDTEACRKTKLDCITNCTKAVKDRVWKQILNPPKPD